MHKSCPPCHHPLAPHSAAPHTLVLYRCHHCLLTCFPEVHRAAPWSPVPLPTTGPQALGRCGTSLLGAPTPPSCLTGCASMLPSSATVDVSCSLLTPTCSTPWAPSAARPLSSTRHTGTRCGQPQVGNASWGLHRCEYTCNCLRTAMLGSGLCAQPGTQGGIEGRQK